MLMANANVNVTEHLDNGARARPRRKELATFSGIAGMLEIKNSVADLIFGQPRGKIIVALSATRSRCHGATRDVIRRLEAAQQLVDVLVTGRGARPRW
jgi:hypothetical protein